ncbi:hypothetical protein SLS57_012115 [Botryosphaeria dothidea]
MPATHAAHHADADLAAMIRTLINRAPRKFHWAFEYGELKWLPAGVQVSRPANENISHEEAMRRRAEQMEDINAWHLQTMGPKLFNEVKSGAYGPGGALANGRWNTRARAAPKPTRAQAAKKKAAARPKESKRAAAESRTTVASSSSGPAAKPSAKTSITFTAPAPPGSRSGTSMNKNIDLPLTGNPDTRSGSTLKLTGLSSAASKIQSANRTSTAADGVSTPARKRKVAEEVTTQEERAVKKPRVAAKQSFEPPATMSAIAHTPKPTGQRHTGKRYTTRSKVNEPMPHQSTASLLSATTAPDSDANIVSTKSTKRKLDSVENAQEESQQPMKRLRAARPRTGTSVPTSNVRSLSSSVMRDLSPSSTQDNAVDDKQTSTKANDNAPPSSPAQGEDGGEPVRGNDGFELIGPRYKFKRGTDQTAHLTIEHFSVKNGTRAKHAHTYQPRKQTPIDWNCKKAIHALNKWYNQYLLRWGCAPLRVDMNELTYREPEYEWCRQYDEEHKNDDPRPDMGQILGAFNGRWTGVEVPYIKNGKQVKTDPRPERTIDGLFSFIDRERLCPNLRPGKVRRRG